MFCSWLQFPGEHRLDFWCLISETTSIRGAWLLCILTSFSIWSSSALHGPFPSNSSVSPVAFALTIVCFFLLPQTSSNIFIFQHLFSLIFGAALKLPSGQRPHLPCAHLNPHHLHSAWDVAAQDIVTG